MDFELSHRVGARSIYSTESEQCSSSVCTDNVKEVSRSVFSHLFSPLCEFAKISIGTSSYRIDVTMYRNLASCLTCNHLLNTIQIICRENLSFLVACRSSSFFKSILPSRATVAFRRKDVELLVRITSRYQNREFLYRDRSAWRAFLAGRVSVLAFVEHRSGNSFLSKKKKTK